MRQENMWALMKNRISPSSGLMKSHVARPIFRTGALSLISRVHNGLLLILTVIKVLTTRDYALFPRSWNSSLMY